MLLGVAAAEGCRSPAHRATRRRWQSSFCHSIDTAVDKCQQKFCGEQPTEYKQCCISANESDSCFVSNNVTCVCSVCVCVCVAHWLWQTSNISQCVTSFYVDLCECSCILFITTCECCMVMHSVASLCLSVLFVL